MGCHFKVAIAEGDGISNKLGQEVLGYLNRIGKRKVCENSVYVAKEMKSLLSFATVREKKVQGFNYKPFVKATPRVSDPVSTLNPEGKRVLEKLRHFVKRDHLTSFMMEHEVSEESAQVLKKLVGEAR